MGASSGDTAAAPHALARPGRGRGQTSSAELTQRVAPGATRGRPPEGTHRLVDDVLAPAPRPSPEMHHRRGARAGRPLAAPLERVAVHQPGGGRRARRTCSSATAGAGGPVKARHGSSRRSSSSPRARARRRISQLTPLPHQVERSRSPAPDQTADDLLHPPTADRMTASRSFGLLLAGRPRPRRLRHGSGSAPAHGGPPAPTASPDPDQRVPARHRALGVAPVHRSAGPRFQGGRRRAAAGTPARPAAPMRAAPAAADASPAGHVLGGRARGAGQCPRAPRWRGRGRAVGQRLGERRAPARSTGTAASAACVGVEQDTAATSSMPSGRCGGPPEMTGTRSATVRHSASSQNAYRSASDPPPRATITTSTSGVAASSRRAAAIRGAAWRSWTGTKAHTSRPLQPRRRRPASTSSRALPPSPVTTPIVLGSRARGSRF